MKSHPKDGELENMRTKYLWIKLGAKEIEFRFEIFSLRPHL